MRLVRLLLTATLFIAAAMIPQVSVSAQDAPSLPSGATSLQEIFEDWWVAYHVVEMSTLCFISQQQTQNGQRFLTIELHIGSNETVTGGLVLPFGLLLEAGLSLQVDNQPALPVLRFRTCLSVGCVVPLALDAATLCNMRTGTALKIIGKDSKTNEDVPFTVSLDGFSAALDRVGVLSRTGHSEPARWSKRLARPAGMRSYWAPFTDERRTLEIRPSSQC